MKTYELNKVQIEDIERILGSRLNRIDNKIKRTDLDEAIQNMANEYRELLEKRRELLGWKEPRVEDMYFSFNGLVLSQLTYTAIICDLIDAYEYLEDEIEEIKSKQKDDGYIFGDEYDQVIERELLENE